MLVHIITFFIDLQLIYSVLGVQQSDSVIHIYINPFFFRFFSIVGYYKIQTIVPCCLVSRVWLCNPMDCSTLGLPVLHHLPEPTQAHVHWVSDAFQPSHPLSFPSLPAFNLSQHQGLFLMSWLFASGGQSIGASASASVLAMNIQGWFPLVPMLY